MANRDLVISDARLLPGSFRNFSGVESKYNRKGDRNFCVIIDDQDKVQELLNDGWNVRCLAPREEGDEPTCYIPVKVSFDNFPPKVFMYTQTSKTQLDEETIGMLDQVEYDTVDLTLSAYNWSVQGKSGIKAYLKTLHVVIKEDVHAAKYAHYDNLGGGIDDDNPF